MATNQQYVDIYLMKIIFRSYVTDWRQARNTWRICFGHVTSTAMYRPVYMGKCMWESYIIIHHLNKISCDTLGQLYTWTHEGALINRIVGNFNKELWEFINFSHEFINKLSRNLHLLNFIMHHKSKLVFNTNNRTQIVGGHWSVTSQHDHIWKWFVSLYPYMANSRRHCPPTILLFVWVYWTVMALAVN